MAFRKEDPVFQKFVNDEFTAMKKSGELAKLQMKWFGATFETPETLPDVLP
jgi:polar amino acid transport system substrate-binding protein